MLYNVLRNRSGRMRQQEVKILSLGMSKHYAEPIRAQDIEVIELDLLGQPFTTLLRARKLLNNADVVSSWLYAGNLLGWVLTLGRKSRLVWNIRHADLARPNKYSTIAVAYLCALLTRRVDCIAYNGMASRKLHESIGYSSDKGVILNNGCDVELFRPVDAELLRTKLQIGGKNASCCRSLGGIRLKTIVHS